jgi:hypothetical protein
MAAVVRPTRMMVRIRKPRARKGRKRRLVLLKIKTPFKAVQTAGKQVIVQEWVLSDRHIETP